MKTKNREVFSSYPTHPEVEMILDSMGRPELDLKSINNVIENILSHLLTSSTISKKELESYSEKLATISDAELCYTWVTTSGEYLFDKRDYFESNDEKFEWLKREFDTTTSGYHSMSNSSIEVGTDFIEDIRLEKKELIETATEYEWDPGQNMVQYLVKYIDLSTACVIWDYLWSEGYVDDYKKQLLTKDEEKRYTEEEYQDLIREMIRDNNEEIDHERGFDTKWFLLEHMSINSIRQFWDTMILYFQIREKPKLDYLDSFSYTIMRMMRDEVAISEETGFGSLAGPLFENYLEVIENLEFKGFIVRSESGKAYLTKKGLKQLREIERLHEIEQLGEIERFRERKRLREIEQGVALNQDGLRLVEERQYHLAEAAFRQAVGMSPDLIEPLINLGNLYFELERLEEAEKAYRKALSFNPNEVIVLSNLGALLQRLGRGEEALDMLKSAINLSPKDTMTWNNLGHALRDLGRKDAAIDAYRSAAQLDPSLDEAWYNLGHLLTELGREDEAREAFRNLEKWSS